MGRGGGKEKTDLTALYSQKYSAENKADLQCLSSVCVLIETRFAASDKQTCVKQASEETKLILNLLQINREILKSATLEKERK